MLCGISSAVSFKLFTGGVGFTVWVLTWGSTAFPERNEVNRENIDADRDLLPYWGSDEDAVKWHFLTVQKEDIDTEASVNSSEI